MTQVKFTKMQGAGNDFILMEEHEYKKIENKFPEIAIKLCDRHFGIGADGIFVPVETSTYSDIGWLFYQADGSTAQMCGNGMRCFARFCYDKGIVRNKEFSVETGAGKIVPEILEDNNVKVNMGKPILVPENIPFKGEKVLNATLWTPEIKKFSVNAVSMGNPHCVIFVNEDEDINEMALKYGDAIEHDELYPEKTNVEFVKVKARNEIDLAVWERGCGITLACGTGACASVVAAILNGHCDNVVKVNLPGGELTIEWNGNIQKTDFDVFMTGSAKYVFTGAFEV